MERDALPPCNENAGNPSRILSAESPAKVRQVTEPEATASGRTARRFRNLHFRFRILNRPKPMGGGGFPRGIRRRVPGAVPTGALPIGDLAWKLHGGGRFPSRDGRPDSASFPSGEPMRSGTRSGGRRGIGQVV